MTKPLALLMAYAVLHAARGVPLGENSSHRIFMPGDLPIIYEVDHDSTRGVPYNGDLTDNDATVAEEPVHAALVRDANGINCGLSIGSIVVDGICQRLLTQAYCAEGDWLVKKKNSDGGECVPRPCPKGQLQLRDTCVMVANNTCSSGQMLYVDLTGHVYCDCEPNYFYNPWVGKCFTEHDRGDCNFGKYLEVTANGVECVPNPCKMEGYQLHEGVCYFKEYRGICEHLLVARYHKDTRTVECFLPDSHTIFDLPTARSCASGSVRGFSRRCRERYTIPSENLYPSSYGTCQGNFVKDARGICRKTHKLFG